MVSGDFESDLIFDLGLHKGLDSEFYLKKGFRVVGLEAVPGLCKKAAELLKPLSSNLKIVNKALGKVADSRVTFYSVPNKDDWGSLDRNQAEKGIETAVEIEVVTTDLKRLFDDHGTPYYLKCDLEGGDHIFLEQLLADHRRPAFVSVEMSNGSEPDLLAEAGYDTAQIVNQWMNPFKQPPQPPREGRFVPRNFTGETSGLFGRELDAAKWRPLSEISEIYRAWIGLHRTDPDLAPGWLDVHVCRRADALGAD